MIFAVTYDSFQINAWGTEQLGAHHLSQKVKPVVIKWRKSKCSDAYSQTPRNSPLILCVNYVFF